MAAAADFATDGLASNDASLSWSETREDVILVGSDAGDDMDDGSDFADSGVAGANGAEANGTSRYAATTTRYEPVEYGPSRPALARSGPFYLVAADTIEMIGTVDSATPRLFAAMLAAHPGVRRLVMVECPGSVDEAANHVLARAVRRAGLDTVVPDNGSVRSGAVELFLAGVHRTAARTAEFGVHSWRDEDGMEANDYPANDPVHAEYISYYREMGLTDAAARSFYAMTNSVPFESVRTLSAADMARLGLAQIAS